MRLLLQQGRVVERQQGPRLQPPQERGQPDPALAHQGRQVQRVVLAVVWGGAAAAILTKVLWVHSPKSLSVVFGIALGWVGIAAMPQLAHTAGPAAVALLGAGGIAYTAGAVVYALRRPALAPAIFGYHELFHALTLVALACQYVAIAFFVVRVG